MNYDYGTKIFSTADIKELDRLTLLTYNISETELIARAAQAFFDAIFQLYPPPREVLLFCGPGNNGNDGRALAPLLAEAGYYVTRYDLGPDDAKPLPAVSSTSPTAPSALPTVSSAFPAVSSAAHASPPVVYRQSAERLLIDALFGAGLNRPLDGVAEAWVRWMNSASGVRIALDIPSGWHGEENTPFESTAIVHVEGTAKVLEGASIVLEGAAIVRAHHTLTLDFPKLSFFFPESAPYICEWQVVPLGLSPQAIAAVETPYRMVSPEMLFTLIKPLPKFLHKGSAGRVRLLAGSPGMMGAAALATKAAYRTGAGWVEVLTPKTEMQLLQMMIPEAIVREINALNAADSSKTFAAGSGTGTSMAFGAGPGMSTSNEAVEHLKDFLCQLSNVHDTTPKAITHKEHRQSSNELPLPTDHRLSATGLLSPTDHRQSSNGLTLDADALNILSNHPHLWPLVPPNTIITPHLGEFKRLAGAWKNDFERLQLQRHFAAQHQVIVVLKGAHTSIALPNGMAYFNTSGNPGMATAGSGDVLTGILLGLLAQGLPPEESAILGVYLHGTAGDLAAEALGQRSVMASDLVDYIHSAFFYLSKCNKTAIRASIQ